jgi:hypothetical protein
MSVIKKFDRIGYYYTFEYYLYEQELDYTVLDYAQNNGIELGSLVCFFDMIKDDVHYIVTTNEKNSHKLISISKSSNVDNLILNNIIYYNCYKLTIFDNMSLPAIENLIRISCDDEIVRTHVNKRNPFNNYTITLWQNICATGTVYINNLRILSVLTNCTCAGLSDLKYDKNIELTIARLDMVKLFPNLKIVYKYEYDMEILYRRKTK